MAKARSTPKAARKRGRKPAKPLPRTAKRRGGAGATSSKRPIAKSRRAAKPQASARGPARVVKAGGAAVRAASARAARQGSGLHQGEAVIPEMQPPPLPSPIASFTF